MQGSILYKEGGLAEYYPEIYKTCAGESGDHDHEFFLNFSTKYCQYSAARGVYVQGIIVLPAYLFNFWPVQFYSAVVKIALLMVQRIKARIRIRSSFDLQNRRTYTRAAVY